MSELDIGHSPTQKTLNIPASSWLTRSRAALGVVLVTATACNPAVAGEVTKTPRNVDSALYTPQPLGGSEENLVGGKMERFAEQDVERKLVMSALKDRFDFTESDVDSRDELLVNMLKDFRFFYLLDKDAREGSDLPLAWLEAYYKSYERKPSCTQTRCTTGRKVKQISQNEKEAMAKAIVDLRIISPDRFSPDQLRLIIKERQNVNAIDDRPLMLVSYPFADHNGAFDIDPTREFSRQGYRVLYYDIATKADYYRAFNEVIANGHNRVKVERKGGHGDKRALIWAEGENLNMGDRDELYKYAPYYDENPVIILESCSNGKDESGAYNMANMHADDIPTATVYSLNKIAGGSRIYFDDNNQVTNVVLGAGPEDTYVINAH